MLEVKDLCKTYYTDNGSVAAVDHVSFSVGEGEVYGLIGLSGAGKSSVIRCLNLLERPDSGSISFDGISLTDLNEAELNRQRHSIGMIFQSFNLFAQKTVFENIAYPLKLQKWKDDEIKTRVLDLLDYVELGDKAQAYPSELSGGQKQRVAIARALAPRPKLLLSDEGTSALDPETTQSILKLIRQAVKDTGISVVMITHQMEVAKSVCDRVAVMEAGKIIEENSVEELFLHPKHQRTKKFIQTVQSELNMNENDNNTTFDLQDELMKKDILQAVSPKAKLYRLAFTSETVDRPIVSDLVRRFAIDVNLMTANMTHIKGAQLGYLVVAFEGDQEQQNRAIEWLEKNNVRVEEFK